MKWSDREEVRPKPGHHDVTRYAGETGTDEAKPFSTENRIMSKQLLPNVNELTENVDVPMWLGVPLATDRPELLKSFAPRTLTAEETAQAVNFIRVLMETNRKLRMHSTQLAEKSRQLFNDAQALRRHLEKLALTAEFQNPDVVGNGEGDE